MQPIILFRKDLDTEGESEIAAQYFPVYFNRNHPDLKNKLVIPRYSCLPYFKELEEDLKLSGSKMINSYEEHKYIANFDYYEDVKEYTPETWFEHDFPYCTYEGPFVVKGRTNSRKHQWKDNMFAPTKQDAIRISSELLSDSLIQDQGVIYRKYIPLKTYGLGINEMPFTNEWRFFFLGKEVITCDYYWSSSHFEHGKINIEGFNKAKEIAKIVSNYTNFFVLDIAETQTGEWILIEVNDGSMSGLSDIDPNLFYQALEYQLRCEYKC